MGERFRHRLRVRWSECDLWRDAVARLGSIWMTTELGVERVPEVRGKLSRFAA